MGTRVGGSSGPAQPDPVSGPSAASEPEPPQTQQTGGRPETEPAGGQPRITDRDAGIRRAEHQLDGTLREAHVRGLPPGTAIQPQEVVDRGRRAGLSDADSQRLQSTLTHIPEGQRQAELQFLNRHVLNSPNADRALRTYMDARAQQERYPDRINDEIVHTLTRSVAEPRSGTSNGREGIMSHSQAQRSLVALSLMPERDYQRVQSLMTQAGQRDGHPVPGADSQLERGLILESLGARLDRIGERERPLTTMEMSVNMPRRLSNIQQIEEYAGQIRGMRRDELIRNSTVMDVQGGTGGLQQVFTTSCAPTSAQITRAEADPIYALQVHRNPRLIEAQQEHDLEAAGGVAVRRPGEGGRGMSIPGVLNDRAAPFTGETYAAHTAADNADARRQRLGEMETALRRGADVPLRMQWGNGGGHFVVATDVRGSSGNREFQITDPYTGRTAWFPENDLASGNTRFPGTGTGRMTAIFLNE